ncbi:MAG: tetratricopeptide repeat protein [Myxococcales bacterium]
MRRFAALALCSLLAAPAARADDSGDPAKIRPTAHASPSGPAPQSFGGEAQPLPPGHPAVGQLPPGHPSMPPAEDTMDSKQLLEKLDAMKDQLKDRPKTAEIEYALGNLYYENSRYPDAIDEYRHLLERSAAPLARYLAARKHPHRSIPPEAAGCPAASHPSYEQLIAIGDAKSAAGDLSAAVTCYEAALLPVVLAKARLANAFFLIGNPDRAAQEHREVLAIEPDFSDSLFFLGAILYESGDGDAAKLRQAADAWKRYLATDPEPDRAKLVRENLAKIDQALRNGGHLPAEAGEAPRGPMAGMGSGPIGPPPPAPELSASQQRELRTAVAEGQRLADKRDWAGSLAAFDRARGIDRADPDAATGAGIALLNLGQRADAEAAFRDALGRDPAHGLALYELGEVFFENEHYAGAARFWGQLEQSDPKLASQVGLSKRLADAQSRAQ